MIETFLLGALFIGLPLWLVCTPSAPKPALFIFEREASDE